VDDNTLCLNFDGGIGICIFLLWGGKKMEMMNYDMRYEGRIHVSIGVGHKLGFRHANMNHDSLYKTALRLLVYGQEQDRVPSVLTQVNTYLARYTY